MKITIIGCGNMGAAFAKRLSCKHTLYLYDRHNEKTKALEQEGHGSISHSLEEALRQSMICILAVKPQGLQEAAKLMSPHIAPNHIVVSLLAGMTTAAIGKHIPQARVIRMMPNLAITYGEGLIGLAANASFNDAEMQKLTELCRLLGKVYWLDEAKMHAFTSLASSGPAFVYALFESMVDAGIAMGFNAQDSQELVHQMIKGSLHLLEKSGKHPGELKWQIASPGGTTIAGLKKLEELAVRGSVINTFLAAYDRANQLST